MAKLGAFPPPPARARMRGLVQYVNDRGMVIAKRWPRRRPGPGTPNQQQARAEFATLAKIPLAMSLLDQAIAKQMAQGSLYVWRDVAERAAIGRLITFSTTGAQMSMGDKIATVTPDGTSNLITFDAIATGYSELLLTMLGRTDAAGAYDQINVTFNDDASISYSGWTWNNTGFFTAIDQPTAAICSINGGGAPANFAAAFRMSIPGYGLYGLYKTLIASSRWQSADAAGSSLVEEAGAIWRNTDAIRSVKLTTAGKFQQGSIATLYGLY